MTMRDFSGFLPSSENAPRAASAKTRKSLSPRSRRTVQNGKLGRARTGCILGAGNYEINLASRQRQFPFRLSYGVTEMFTLCSSLVRKLSTVRREDARFLGDWVTVAQSRVENMEFFFWTAEDAETQSDCISKCWLMVGNRSERDKTQPTFRKVG